MVQVIETSAIVKGTPEQVRAVLSDFKNWKEWNNFIIDIDYNDNGKGGEPSPGDKLNVTTTSVGSFVGTVVTNDDHELSWVGVVGSDYIFKGVHYFKIEKIDEDHVKFYHGERFQGLLWGPFKWFKGEDNIRALYQSLTDGMAKRVEELNKN